MIKAVLPIMKVQGPAKVDFPSTFTNEFLPK